MGFPAKNELRHRPNKPSSRIIFSKKTTKKSHAKIFFYNISARRANSQKHLGLELDSKLSFNIHIKTISTKVIKL